MTNTVCNAVTHTVRSDVRRSVQNQNQNQTLLTVSCGSDGYSRIRNNGDLHDFGFGIGS